MRADGRAGEDGVAGEAGVGQPPEPRAGPAVGAFVVILVA